MTQRPVVTVAMPVYNGAPTLHRAISSVLAQTFQDFELLIIDDGSSDTSLECIESFQDKRIRLIVHDANRGLAGTRNHLVEESRGTYVAWLDQDDTAATDRLSSQIAVLQQDSAVGLCSGWANVRTENATSLFSRSIRRTFEHGMTSDGALQANLIFKNVFPTSTTSVRRSVLIDNSLRFHQDYAPSEDYQMWVQISRQSKVRTVPRTLGTIWELQSGASAQGRERQILAARAVRKHLLKDLGIPLESDALSKHQLVCEVTTATPTRAELASAAEWLGELLDWNRRTRTFDQNELVSACVERFGFLVARCLQLHPRATPPLLSNSLTSQLPAVFLRRIVVANRRERRSRFAR